MQKRIKEVNVNCKYEKKTKNTEGIQSKRCMHIFNLDKQTVSNSQCTCTISDVFNSQWCDTFENVLKNPIQIHEMRWKKISFRIKQRCIVDYESFSFFLKKTCEGVQR